MYIHLLYLLRKDHNLLMKKVSFISDDDIRHQIISSPSLTDSKKKELLEIVSGNRIVPLMSDIMAKHLYSPDAHPERFDALMRKITKDPSIMSDTNIKVPLLKKIVFVQLDKALEQFLNKTLIRMKILSF